MLTTGLILSLLLCLLFPLASRYLYRLPGFPRFFTPIVSCYAVGIIISNLRLWEIPTATVNQVAEGSMLLALPLLLFSINLRESWRYTGRMMTAFLLCCLSGMVCTGGVAYVLQDFYPDGWRLAGMLTGLFTGGTPNMQALGIALDSPPEYVVLLQAADIIGGGLYLLLLISVLHTFFGFFLPDFRSGKEDADSEPDPVSPPAGQPAYAAPLGLTFLIAGGSLGITWLFTGSMTDGTMIVLLLTTLSLLATLIPAVRRWSNSYDLGEYFLLIFCVALGLMADFRELLSDGLPLLYFTLLTLGLTILLHWLLAWLFRIDRDTLMLSSTAALYGPVFVAQVAAAIGNRRLLAPGIATGLFGFAIGNYLGLSVAYGLKWLLAAF